MNPKIQNFFNSFSKKNQDRAVGIDIGSSSIKIVELNKKHDKAVLETYGEIALGPYAGVQIGQATRLAPDKISEALNDVLKESNASTPSSAISIPMRSSMVSIFKMPKLNNKQLGQMIPIEARKYIPVPIAEVSLDWFVIPADPMDIMTEEELPDAVVQNNKGKPLKIDKFVEAMVVAIHNDVLSDYSKIVEASALDTSFFEVEMFSTIRSVIDASDSAPIIIIDVGASATKVYISERGLIRDSHILPKGSQIVTINAAENLGVELAFAEQLKRNYGSNEKKQDDALAESISWLFDPLFSDIKNILLNFQQKYRKTISRAVLVGGGSLLNGLPERAQQKIGIEVVMGNPFAKVEAPAFLADVLKETGANFSVAIGLALRRLQELG